MKILTKTKVHTGGGFTTADDWHIKNGGTWKKAKRVYQKTADGWRAVHYEPGTEEIIVFLSVSAGVHTVLDIVALLKEQTGFSDSFISTYPFKIELTIKEDAVVMGDYKHLRRRYSWERRIWPNYEWVDRGLLELYMPALTIAGLSDGSSVKIKNYGKIYGRGGAGGQAVGLGRGGVGIPGLLDNIFINDGRNGGTTYSDEDLDSNWARHFRGLEPLRGRDGGTAIYVAGCDVTLHNYSTGEVCGGGGGGAAGWPVFNAWVRYMRTRGGPQSTLFGSPFLGTTWSTPYAESWMVLDIGSGGSGGGGAPYGIRGTWHGKYGGSVDETDLSRGHFIEDFRRIALAYDPRLTVHAGAYVDGKWVPSSACESYGHRYWKNNGLDIDSLGASTYYPEASTPQKAEEGVAGLVHPFSTPTNILSNYKWNIRGTWYGMFWPSKPYVKDFVSKTIEVRGPKIKTYKERNERAENNGAAEGSDGTLTEGGAGGTAGFYPVEAPKADEFGAPASVALEEIGCSTLIKISPFSRAAGEASAETPILLHNSYVFTAFWDDWLHYGDTDPDPTTFDTTSNILGDSSNGGKGGDLGVDGESVLHWGRKFTNAGSLFVDIPPTNNWGTPTSDGKCGVRTVIYGGVAGYAIETDNNSSVSFGTKEGSYRGRESYHAGGLSYPLQYPWRCARPDCVDTQYSRPS